MNTSPHSLWRGWALSNWVCATRHRKSSDAMGCIWSTHEKAGRELSFWDWTKKSLGFLASITSPAFHRTRWSFTSQSRVTKFHPRIILASLPRKRKCFQKFGGPWDSLANVPWSVSKVCISSDAPAEVEDACGCNKEEPVAAGGVAFLLQAERKIA